MGSRGIVYQQTTDKILIYTGLNAKGPTIGSTTGVPGKIFEILRGYREGTGGATNPIGGSDTLPLREKAQITNILQYQTVVLAVLVWLYVGGVISK